MHLSNREMALAQENAQPDPEILPAQPGDCSAQSRILLALTLIPGLGPVRIAHLIDAIGSPEGVLSASASQISRVRGIGSSTATSIAEHLHLSIARVDHELERVAEAGAHVVSVADPHYPPMLAQTPSAPPILMIRGQFDHRSHNQYTVSIVGSRSCSIYGSEQAQRFASAFAGAGLTVISGGARGIDTAAHQGAIRAGGSTAVVLGCGIGKVYPPENAALFDEIVDSGGSIISELPVNAAPDAKNFPARNRIISGLSLGVVVIEAGLKSGALITARHAIEDHGREVMGVPGRVDSSASSGTHELLKAGAHLVTDPADVISILERDAFHLYSGTHKAKTANPTHSHIPSEQLSETVGQVDDDSAKLLRELGEPRTGDELAEVLGVDPGQIRAKLTMLEIQGRVRRSGSRFERVR
jgi:DNA processing protein